MDASNENSNTKASSPSTMAQTNWKKTEPVHRYVDDIDELILWDLNSTKAYVNTLPAHYQKDFTKRLFSEYFILLIENSQLIIEKKQELFQKMKETDCTHI